MKGISTSSGIAIGKALLKEETLIDIKKIILKNQKRDRKI